MLAVYQGEGLGSYGYEEKDWFLPHVRLEAFLDELTARGLRERVCLREAPPASDDDLLAYHTREHIERMQRLCRRGEGALDHGPTFARPHIEVAARYMVGAVLHATRAILAGSIQRAFVPIAGFHHARADRAKDYCVYNDCALAIGHLLDGGIAPVAYVDVDYHHGDGVFAAFADDLRVRAVDLFGEASEPTDPPSTMNKLNIRLPAGSGDEAYLAAWERAEAFLEEGTPAFYVFEAGVDALAGDPLGDMVVTPVCLKTIAERVRALAELTAHGRLLVLGGGGYAVENVRAGWAAVVEALI